MVDKSSDIVRDVKRRMLEALRAREDIAGKVRGYHLEGRTKGLVSTFRKVTLNEPTGLPIGRVMQDMCRVVIASSTRHGVIESRKALASALFCSFVCAQAVKLGR